MVQYKVISDQFPSPFDTVDIGAPKQVRDQVSGEIHPNLVDIMLTFVNHDGATETVPFTCSPDDDVDYGRQMYADLTGTKPIVYEKLVYDGEPKDGEVRFDRSLTPTEGPVGMGYKAMGFDKIGDADPWIGPPPEPEPDPRDAQIEALEARLTALEGRRHGNSGH